MHIFWRAIEDLNPAPWILEIPVQPATPMARIIYLEIERLWFLWWIERDSNPSSP